MALDEELTAFVRNMKDRQDILDCLHRYTRGVDRHDRALMLSAYHPDAFDEHGVAEGVAKTVSRRVLEPVLALEDPVHLTVHEDRHDNLLAELARYRIDVILSDGPVGANARVRASTSIRSEC